MYNRLLNLVGKIFSYQGCRWLLIEVMPELDSLVLRRLDSDKLVQTNQFGNANRLSHETLTLKISETNNQDYSQEVLILLSGIEKRGSA